MSNLTINDPDIQPNTLKMMIQDTEWIRISDEGFWVRGVKVEQGPKEAEQVYQAFKEFLVWSGLTRDH